MYVITVSDTHKCLLELAYESTKSHFSLDVKRQGKLKIVVR